jgi:hypothetical protein
MQLHRHMPLGTLQKWCGVTSSLQIAFSLSSLSAFCLSSHFKYHKIMDIQKTAKSWAPCQALESEPPSCSLIFGIHVNEAITHKDVRLTNHSARLVHEQFCPHQVLQHWHIAFKSSTKMKIGFGTFLPICICWINPDPSCLCPHFTYSRTMAVWQATFAICASGRAFCWVSAMLLNTHLCIKIGDCLFVCLDLSWPCHSPPRPCGPLLCFWQPLKGLNEVICTFVVWQFSDKWSKNYRIWSDFCLWK